MKDLIEALQILLKYEEPEGLRLEAREYTISVTWDMEPEISNEDCSRLVELGFWYDEDDCSWSSYPWPSSLGCDHQEVSPDPESEHLDRCKACGISIVRSGEFSVSFPQDSGQEEN